MTGVQTCALPIFDDVSETVRFAQIRDSFIINVSEQLLGPTQALGVSPTIWRPASRTASIS